MDSAHEPWARFQQRSQQESSPKTLPTVLYVPMMAAAFLESGTRKRKTGRTISARLAAVNRKMRKLTKDQAVAVEGRCAPSTAGHAHMPGDAGPIVPAVDDEIMPFRLGADGAVYCRTQQGIVG